MTVLWWVILGALAGWIATIITRTNEQVGALGNIVLGIIGALVGGFLLRLAGFNASGSFLASLLTAIFGAVILLAVVKGVRRRSTMVR